MTKRSIGFFSWSMEVLVEAVSRAEAEGHSARGYCLRMLDGYSFVVHDALVFVEHAPEALAAWAEKAERANETLDGVEISMPSPFDAAFEEPLQSQAPSAEPASEPAAEIVSRETSLSLVADQPIDSEPDAAKGQPFVVEMVADAPAPRTRGKRQP